MPNFKAKGKHYETGKMLHRTYQVPTETEALHKALANGMIVEDIRLVPDESTPPRQGLSASDIKYNQMIDKIASVFEPDKTAQARKKKCRYCAMMIPKDASICPFCTRKTGLTMPTKIFAAILLVGLIGSFASLNGPNRKEETSIEQAIRNAIPVTSEQLYKEYEENEIAADLKYKNKFVRVTGEIRDIGKMIGDKPYLNLSTGPFSHQVIVLFPADVFNDKLATFKHGNRIELTGTCTGKTMGMVKISLR